MPRPNGAGWRFFAGVMIILGGAFNFIDGIVAVQNAHWYGYYGGHLIFGNLNAWGWTILCLGLIEFLVGLAILAGQVWAAYVGIFFAVLDAIGQLLYLPVYPVWAILTIAINVLVIYGLAMYGTQPAAD